MRELPKNLEKEIENIPEVKEKNLKLDHRKESQKVNNFTNELMDTYEETASSEDCFFYIFGNFGSLLILVS